MPAASPPPLVLVAHGTRDSDGQQVVDELASAVADALPGVAVVQAYVDVQQPSLEDALRELATAGRLPAVVVPLLLSRGYHVKVDVAEAVSQHPGTISTGALGPDEALSEALRDRLQQCGATAEDHVVLAVAGSRDPDGAADAEAARGLLAHRGGLGYISAAEPTVQQAVDAVRASIADRVTQEPAASGERLTGRARVVIAPYLISPGFFLQQLQAAGADLVAAPLGAHPAIVQLVCRRYRSAANVS